MAVTVLTGCKEEAVAPEPARAVRTVEVTAEATEEAVTRTGEIVPMRALDLAFKVPGRILQRDVTPGDRVRSGDLLATIDPRDIENSVAMAEAEVAAAEAAEAAARAQAERQRQLFEKGIVAEAALQAAEAEAEAAKGRLNSERAKLASARDQRSYADLRAPVDGIITAVMADPGEVVASGQPVVQVAAGSAREAAFNLSAELASQAKPGLAVEVMLLSDPTVTTTGTLREVSPVADPVTRTYRVFVTLPDAPDAMSFGSVVEGKVLVPVAGRFTIPAAAITVQDGAPAVYVVDAGMKLERRPVTILRYETATAILSGGIGVGDRVVTAGVSKLRPGQDVTLWEAAQ
ncbi:efflux RND transporter periplasmic adaptor subunit [Tabrizicola sp. TH137]|uniref:efflux RND transporter periplasmic adaptor subunit n=1 Tax=Tabrizicola sp. TH137 TaxID=2067452 RepID=UPI0013043871|nr:efflux RND transporter periplasmic adaptor subunit [Tabrizicola sp. TH137]